MRGPAVTVLAVLLGLTVACDSLPFVGRGNEEASAGDTAATETPTAPDTAAPATPPPAAPETATTAQAAQPERPAPRRTGPTRAQPQETPPSPGAQPAAARRDQPWTPRFTGTIDPGMTQDEVIAMWGPPVARRSTGSWTYLYFRNGCEVTCGTFDVVFLQDGQVVDAIVRGEGHLYSGVSSSPPGRPAAFTPPGGDNGARGEQG